MKHLRCLLIIFSLIFGGASVVAAQDINKGIAAWERKKWAAALREFVPLAQGGHHGAQFALGQAYLAGNGLKKDEALGAKWMRRSADQGNSYAQFWLGVLYVAGKGVPQNYRESVKWYRKSAEQGNAESQYPLALAYYNGLGVPQDSVSAHMWANIAASLGHAEAAKYREDLEEKMTGQDIAKAQKRASACVSKNYKGC